MLINDFGEGYSTFNNLLLTKYKDGIKQGNCVYIKDLDMGKTIFSNSNPQNCMQYTYISIV